MNWGWERRHAPLRVSAGAMARVMMLALALATAGCGSAGGLPGTTRTPTNGSATPTPGHALSWRAVAFPASVSAATAALAVSPINGAEAWVCAPGAGGTFQIWRTRDEARTWALASTLTPGAQLATPVCSVSPDQGVADALAVNIGWGGGNGPTALTPASGSVDYYSADGGATWMDLPADLWLQQVFTAGAMAYALALDLTSPNSTASLLVSEDHFATWRTIATPPEQPTANDDLWVASDPNALIWSQMNNNAAFTSSDGGATWTPLPTPPAQPFQVILAAWPTGSTNWLLCGYSSVSSSTGPATTNYFCSADRGATWRSIPGLTDTWSCDHCGAGAQSGTEPCLPNVISGAGALLAMCGVDSSQDTAGAPPPPGLTLLRLAPGAATWTVIGKTPCPFSSMVTLAETGQLWCQLPATQPPQINVLEQVS